MTEAEQKAAVLRAIWRHIMHLEADLEEETNPQAKQTIETKIHEADDLLKVIYKAFSKAAAGGAA